MSRTLQTLRVTGLPALATADDVRKYFELHARHHNDRVVEDIGPICKAPDSNTNQTTVTFSSREAAGRGLGLGHMTRRFTASAGGTETIHIDDQFLGMTTLQSLANPKTNQPDIDIVCLHGLTGHGWNTFTASETSQGRTRENNWLQENLPRLLRLHGERNIYARVMSFGYDADVWMTKSNAQLDEPIHSLMWSLNVLRQNSRDRPLFFIAHSLGGLVVKEVIVKLANTAQLDSMSPHSASQGRYIFPVKGCLFFGVPHQGAKIAEIASGLLKALAGLFNINRGNVVDLQPKSDRLARISREFEVAQRSIGFPVMSFYEIKSMNGVVGRVVSRESAIYDYPGKPEPFGIDKDHREMVKISADNDEALGPTILFITDLAKKALNSHDRVDQLRKGENPLLHAGHADSNGRVKEDELMILANYDTVFLIDDSPSMADGGKWEMVKTILDFCTPVAAKYDPNGIDIHFFNNRDLDQNDVTDPEIAVQIHHDITLRGRTPLLNRISVHLKKYFQGYKKAEYDADHKGLNLIILTDGEPDPEHDDKPDPNDPTKPAFKLLRQKNVEYAKKLDHPDVEAEPGQIGIQFCQIGKDEDATAFFNFLDDRLVGKEKLDRDMVDTVRCSSEDDLTEEFFVKLLIGAVDKLHDNKNIVMPPQAPPEYPPMPFPPMPDRTGSMRSNLTHSSAEPAAMGNSTRVFSFPTEAIAEEDDREGIDTLLQNSRQDTLRSPPTRNGSSYSSAYGAAPPQSPTQRHSRMGSLRNLLRG